MSWDIRDGFDVIFADYQAPAGLCQSPGFSELCNHFLRLSQGQMFRPLLVHLWFAVTILSPPLQCRYISADGSQLPLFSFGYYPDYRAEPACSEAWPDHCI